jgi:putative Mg2+ transporter-C (MgtC) family protein
VRERVTEMDFREVYTAIIDNERFANAIEAFVRLALAGVFGGIVGFEREHSHRPAGFRTHILVSVGSALVMLTSGFIFKQYEGLTNLDPARLGAQVISGIGFLGAGTILREGFSVRGLTTAASLWAVSCIGLAVGIGYYEGAVIATIFIMITLYMLKKVMNKNYKGSNISIIVKEVASASKKISDLIQEQGANLKSMEIVYPEKDENFLTKKKESVILRMFIMTDDKKLFTSIKDSIMELEEVEEIYVD